MPLQPLEHLSFFLFEADVDSNAVWSRFSAAKVILLHDITAFCVHIFLHAPAVDGVGEGIKGFRSIRGGR